MKKQILLLCLALISLCGYAQNITVKGVVTSAADKEPMIGLTALIKGTTNGTVTDLDGNYTLNNVPKDAIVVFSMIGYKTQEIKVNGRTTINVVMQDDTQALDEVVVIGYGAVKKGDLTSSIAAIKGDELKTLSSGNAMNSLQGKINGVQISSAGGPGTVPRVIIRGVSTVNGSNPLYVVDGMPVGDNINFLDQNDIESMQVLKDASASAIYGTRGSNGVVLITTKKGTKGATKFTFTASAGFQTLEKPDMAKASEYEYVLKSRYINDGNVPMYVGYNGITDAEGTDWWDETMRKTALIHNYNLSFSGGTDKLLYSASIGYFGQDSQYKIGNWQKFTARFSMEYTFNNIVKAGIDFTPKYENWKDTPDLIGSIMAMDPTTPVMRPESEWTDNEYDNYSRSHNSQVWNPVANMARMAKNTDEYGLLATPFINIEPIKGLIFRSQLGLNARFRLYDEFTPTFDIDNLERAETSVAKREMKNWIDWNWTNTLTWIKSFNQKHNLNIMAGYTMERFQHYWLTGSRDGIPTNHELLQYVSAGTKNQQASGTNSYSSLISYLGRVMYNYNDRYYLTASVRVDGSSKFVKGNKYATFPAVSGAWRVTGEEFMKDQHIFDNLKIRAGWGRVGNQNLPSGVYMSQLGQGYYVLGDNVVNTVYPSLVKNEDVKWETVEDYNFGIDYGLFDNRLTGSFEYYIKNTKDMLFQKAYPSYSGYPGDAKIWTNVGSMRTKGFEMAISYNDRWGDFTFGTTLNLTTFNVNMTELTGDKDPLYGNGEKTKTIEGEEPAFFYGYVADGIFQNQTEVNRHTNNKGQFLQPNAQVGDIRFKDINGDGQLNADDRTKIGSPWADMTMGLNLNLGYKNFDLVANFYASIGNDLVNQNIQELYNAAGSGGKVNKVSGLLDMAWHGEGTSNYVPRLSTQDHNENFTKFSSFYIEDGSYLRLKNLQLGYTFKKIPGVNKLRLYIAGQNLFTLTGYNGVEPEVSGSVLSFGFGGWTYPVQRIYSVGVNVTF